MSIEPMIHIIDANSAENTHILFNASMTKVLLDAYPEHQVSFYSGGPHQLKISEYLTENERHRIKFVEIPTKTVGRGKIQKAFRVARNTLIDFSFFRRILSKVTTSRTDKVIVFKAHPASILMIKYLKIFYAKADLMAVMHGEIEFIYYAETEWQKNIASIYKRIIAVSASNFRYILLNKISKHKLISDGLLKTQEIIEIDHPYPYSEISDKTANLSTPITFGQVGSLGLRKNAHLIYQLASAHSTEIECGFVRFVTIGPIEDDAIPYRNPLVVDFTGKNRDQYISRQTFIEETQKVDYAVFFYGPDQFIFRASGSVMDAIDLAKPIIAIKHPFFDYLVKEAGNIGFICEDLPQMSALISRLAKRNSALVQQYQDQRDNLEKFKREHNIARIAADFKLQVH